MKKLIVSICTLAVSAAILCTSTYAWFSMNKTVTAGGMNVTSRADSNLFIDDKATGNWATDDSTFGTSFTVNGGNMTATKLAPVSTVDGKNFFFIDDSNVKADGSAKEKTYTAYAADALNAKYDGCVGYVDFTYILKAQNTSDAAQYIILNALNLTYNGKYDGNKAFRVAVISNKFTEATENGNKTSPDAAKNGTAQLYAPADAEHFTTGKAVDSVNSVGAVNYVTDSVALATVTAGATEYYEVTVRLWLEGEDKTCNVDNFKTVGANWTLSIGFELATGNTGAVKALAMEVTNA